MVYAYSRWFLLYMSLMSYAFLCADLITIKNTTTQPIYVAAYYVEGKSLDNAPGKTERISNIHFIAPAATKTIERPEKKDYRSRLNEPAVYDRDIYISTQKDQLTESLIKGSLPSFNIGDTQGSTFTISSLGVQPTGFSDKNSDFITVHNETEKNIFAAIYYVQGRSGDQKIGGAFRFNGIASIPAHSEIKMLRPPRRCSYYINNSCSNFEDRDLYISDKLSDLDPIIPKGSRASVNIGTTEGSNFYIVQEDGQLKGYNFLSRGVRPLTKVVKKTVGQLKDIILDPIREKFQVHAYANKQAFVRTSGDISSQEKACLDKRLPQAKKAIEELLKEQLTNDEVPRIAICGSGGGYRAAISVLGFFQGADEFGLLNSCIYNTGISGSTWAIAGWTQSNMPIGKYIDQVAQQSSKIFTDLSSTARQQIQTVILKKIAFGQSVSMLDIYGALLAQKFLKNDNVDNPQAITLADQTSLIENGNKPFPIYTAFIDQQPYVYVEFTPYEVGSTQTQTYIPSWALGRTFKAGTSQDFAPALSLGFFMGICGSAMSANVKDILNAAKTSVESPQNNLIVSQIEFYAKKIPQISGKRGLSAQVSNWMRGMPGPWEYINQLTLVDAGVALNIPILPALQAARNVSIMLILDASIDIKDAPELRVAENYARTQKLNFPKIDYTRVNSICSVHQDDDPATPTVIYMPLMPNKNYEKGWDPQKEKFTSTFNFVYAKEQIKKLSGLTRQNMLESKDLIIDAIKKAIEKKRALKKVSYAQK